MAEITRNVAIKVLDIVDAGLSSGIGTRRKGMMGVEAAVCYALGLPHGDNPDCVSPALRSFMIALNDAGWSSKKARAAGLRRLAIIQLGSAGALDDIEFVRRLALMTTNKIIPHVLRIAAMKMPKEHSEAMEVAAVRCEGAEELSEASAACDAASEAARATCDAADYAAWAARSGTTRDVASNATWAVFDAANFAGSAASAARYAASDRARAASKAIPYAATAANFAARTVRYTVSDRERSRLAEDAVQILIEMGVPGARWLDLAPLAA